MVESANSYKTSMSNYGKFIDRFPDYPSAGRICTTSKESVADCLNYPTNKPPTPEPCMRLRQWTWTPVDTQRVHPAQFYDTQRQRARTMIHGLTLKSGMPAAELINPIPKSIYQQKYNDKLESIYESVRTRPLGRVIDPKNSFPEGYNWKEATFGVKHKSSGSAKELINPDKTFAEVYQQDISDHDTYMKSHKHLYPGEQSKRGYSANPSFTAINSFGIPTPIDSEGRLTKACLRWHTDREYERRNPIVEKRLESFHERTKHQLGIPIDPIKDTMHVSSDHVFGKKVERDLYQTADLLHGRVPMYFNTGPDRQRGIVGAIRSQLRALHYSHYMDLRAACQILDPENTGLLTEEDMRSVCAQFDLPVDHQLLEQAFDIYYENGKINWIKFTDCFNWQDKVDYQKMERDYSYTGDVCESNVADWNLQNRLQKDVEKRLGTWTTSSSMYNGGGLLYGKNFPAMGISSIRPDKPIPKVRKVTDQTNYGEEGGAACLLRPSIMTLHGVAEMDLLLPRSNKELQNLYESICPNGNPATFDKILQLATKMNNGRVINLDAFKKAMLLVESQRIQCEVEHQIPLLEGCLS